PGVDGQCQNPRRRRQRRQRQGVERDPPYRRLAAGAEQVDVVPMLHERRHEACRRPFDSAVEDERPRDDEELHWSGGREAGFDRGWPDTDARGSDTPALARGATDARGSDTPALARGATDARGSDTPGQSWLRAGSAAAVSWR